MLKYKKLVKTNYRKCDMLAGKTELTLDMLKIGQSAKITAVKGENEGLRRRLMDMGMIKGTEVKLCKRAPMGDPLEITLRGYQLTLRAADARNIILNN